MPALETRGVTKSFGGVTALRDVDLTVREGEVFGFLGPNGAGKSTTINIVLDYLKPTSGSVEVFGIDAQTDPVAVREHVGVLPEGFNVLGEMTGREHLAFAAESKGASDDPDAILDLVGLDGVGDRSLEGALTGTDRRVGERRRRALGDGDVGVDLWGVAGAVRDDGVHAGVDVGESVHRPWECVGPAP